MSSDLSYVVLPVDAKKESIPLSREERSNLRIRPQGAVLLGIVIAIASTVLWGSLVVGVVLGGLCGILTYFAIRHLKIQQRQKRKAEDANKRSIEEAIALTRQLHHLYQSSADLGAVLPKRLDDAYSWLPYADGEYGSNAFGNFWDAIENSTVILGDFTEGINRLTGNAAEYSRLLHGREHSFPPFPVKNGTIPDPTFTVGELQRIARLGQTNFEFANIWEHRRTRQVLVAGFRNLGEAVNELGYTLVN